MWRSTNSRSLLKIKPRNKNYFRFRNLRIINDSDLLFLSVSPLLVSKMIRVVVKTVTRLNSQCKFYSTVSGGVQGVEGRVPRVNQRSENTTSLSITDPYLIYLGYIQQGILEKMNHNYE